MGTGIVMDIDNFMHYNKIEYIEISKVFFITYNVT